MKCMANISVLKYKKNHRKVSYELRVYESVDNRSLTLGNVSRIGGKQNSGTEGLNGSVLFNEISNALHKIYLLLGGIV